MARFTRRSENGVPRSFGYSPRMTPRRAEALFARNPKHPGAAHYILHAYDHGALAEKGLAAARASNASAAAAAGGATRVEISHSPPYS